MHTAWILVLVSNISLSSATLYELFPYHFRHFKFYLYFALLPEGFIKSIVTLFHFFTLSIKSSDVSVNKNALLRSPSPYKFLTKFLPRIVLSFFFIWTWWFYQHLLLIVLYNNGGTPIITFGVALWKLITFYFVNFFRFETLRSNTI